MPFPHYPQHSLPRLIGDAMPVNQKGMHSDPIPTRRDRHCLRMVARHYGKPTYAFASVGRHYNLETLRERSHITRELVEVSPILIGTRFWLVLKNANFALRTSKSNRFSEYGAE